MKIILLLAGLFLYSYASAECEKPECEKKTNRFEYYSVDFENDMLGSPPSDRDYTMGLSISHKFTEAKDGDSSSVPLWYQQTISIAKFFDQLHHDGDVSKTNSTWWQIGSTDFTPNNLIDPAPIYNDRPYASLFYLEAGYSRNVHNDTEKIVNLYWGVLGTNIGRDVQTAIHRQCCTNKIPQGWSHQIGDGGSPTFLFQEEWINHIWKSTYANLNYSYGYSLGYYVRGILGATLNFGGSPADIIGGEPPSIIPLEKSLTEPSQSIPNYNPSLGEPPVLVPYVVRPKNVAEAAAPKKNNYAPESNPTGLSAKIKYELNYFAYNELLQGAWSGRNDVTYAYSQIYPLVHLASVEIELTFIPYYFGIINPKNERLYLSQQWKSKEINTPLEVEHSWGGIYFKKYF